MEYHILGTSSMVPTKERNVTGNALVYKGEIILFDCGEGTQRQMNIAGLNRVKVKKILISHWHGDHVAGLIGLLQTIGNSDSPSDIEIFGPKSSEERIEYLKRAIVWDTKVNIQVKELEPSTVECFYENSDYRLLCAPLEHSTPCLGYRFEEKDKLSMLPKKLKEFGITGRNIGRLQQGQSIEIKGKAIKPEDVSKVKKGRILAHVFDTQLCKGAADIASGADVLISECQFDSSLQDKADAFKHMTVKDACQIANMSGTKKLILTHFSQRYKSLDIIEDEAKTLFQNVELARDFMVVKF